MFENAHWAITTTAVVAQASAPKAPAKKEGDPLNLFLMIGIMIFAFWFIVQRPQRKERQERQRLLDNVKKGDKVVTIGGVHGKVAEVDASQGIIGVEVSPKVVIKFSKASIASVDAKDTSKTQSPAQPEESEKKQS